MRITDLQEKEFNYFYGTYLNALDENEDLMAALLNGRVWFQAFIKNLTEEQLGFSYGEGKWTIAEVLVHLIDTERIFQHRAFRISRNDKTPLPGFEQDDYIIESDSNERTKKEILNEYLSVRDSSINLFRGMTEVRLKRFGTASGMPWSVAAIGLAISGHQKHHEIILNERYLNN
ncbi:DinB family protein [Maribacter sp. ACAM166]|uniref:DinB family protein n=1 Tax=Maribacter sp. ACAM166 TaxID=2508996 RepID=UPI0010FD65CB|nr:DinB family protein [Maribacter sp. ACAM166]TLP79654.1 DinB family protein [Maribacter sp. ACAM166]